MSIEEQYDAWVRGLMGSTRAGSKRDAEEAARSVEEMQRALEQFSAPRKDPTEAVQRAAGATAENVRRMSSELTRSLQRDGLLDHVPEPRENPAPAKKGDFVGLADKVRARVLGQDAFVGALVKAFRRPFVMGVPRDSSHVRGLMLLCGTEGTGRHYALNCVAEEMAARGLLSSARIETMDLSLYPGPAQEKLFLQDLYAALQSKAEILAFDHYESCASSYLNMLATLAIDGTLALSSRYVLQRGILVDVGTALAPGAVGELEAGGKYFVFFSHKGPEALAERFGARFVDALSGDICSTQPFTPESLNAIAARELNSLAQKVRAQCGLVLAMGYVLTLGLAGVVLLLSSLMKNPYGVVITSVLFLCVPLFLSLNEGGYVWKHLLGLLPEKIADFGFWSYMVYRIGGLTVTWPAAAMIVNGVCAVLLSGLAYGFFRRHQVNK